MVESVKMFAVVLVSWTFLLWEKTITVASLIEKEDYDTAQSPRKKQRPKFVVSMVKLQSKVVRHNLISTMEEI
jgi:hypothetical protein